MHRACRLKPLNEERHAFQQFQNGFQPIFGDDQKYLLYNFRATMYESLKYLLFYSGV